MKSTAYIKLWLAATIFILVGSFAIVDSVLSLLQHRFSIRLDYICLPIGIALFWRSHFARYGAIIYASLSLLLSVVSIIAVFHPPSEPLSYAALDARSGLLCAALLTTLLSFWIIYIFAFSGVRSLFPPLFERAEQDAAANP